MDMWEPYEQSVRGHVADAEDKIAFDKFHIAQHLCEGVDRVRRKENKELRAEGDNRLVGAQSSLVGGIAGRRVVVCSR
jgi:transposase